MKKAFTIGLNSNGKLEVNVLNNKTPIEKVDSGIVVNNITTVKYVKVKNKSDIAVNIFNFALDIKREEELTKVLTEDEEEFIYGSDCDYNIWIAESLIGVELGKEIPGTLKFKITDNDIKK